MIIGLTVILGFVIVAFWTWESHPKETCVSCDKQFNKKDIKCFHTIINTKIYFCKDCYEDITLNLKEKNNEL